MSDVVEGELVVERVRPAVLVKQAPQTARITLSAIQAADPVELRVDGNQIIVGGGQAVYQVTGWDPAGSCLITQRRE